MIFPYSHRMVNQLLLPVLMFGLVACGTAGSGGSTATQVPASAPTIAPPEEAPAPATVEPPTEAVASPTLEPVTDATAAPEPTAVQPSFVPATYTDETAGFALEYPAEWTVDPSSQIGVRGGQALLLSLGTTAETLADGGTRVSIVTYVWDPKQDLDAYVAQRKVAWNASGFAILREEEWQLVDGRAVRIFVAQTPEQPTFFLFTTVGDDYLQISGEGDSALVEEIARTLRPLSSGS